jgi:hypothetical protein
LAERSAEAKTTIMSFYGELKRRNVVKAAALFVAAS